MSIHGVSIHGVSIHGVSIHGVSIHGVSIAVKLLRPKCVLWHSEQPTQYEGVNN